MDNLHKTLTQSVYTSDGSEKTPDSFPTFTESSNSDHEYFEGRTDGYLDAENDIAYIEPTSVSKKYARGYKNGYKKYFNELKALNPHIDIKKYDVNGIYDEDDIQNDDISFDNE